MATGRDSSGKSLRDIGTCVVLARGDDLPPGLLSSLERHGIETLVIGHPVLAFAELLRLHQTVRRRRTALVVVNRDRWPSIEPLLRATREHLPRASVWVGSGDTILEVTARSAATPTGLRLRVDDEAEDSTSAGTPEQQKTPSAEPTSPSGQEPGEPSARTPPTMDSGVTPDEIEMLLRLFDEEEGGTTTPEERP